MHGLCALVHELVGTVSMCMNYIAGTGPIKHASQAGINPIRANFKLRAVHSVAKLNMAAHVRNRLSHVLALCGVFPAENGKDDVKDVRRSLRGRPRASLLPVQDPIQARMDEDNGNGGRRREW